MDEFTELPPKKKPSAKALQELFDLLMKINSRLREKISPLKKDLEESQTDVVIIIMTHKDERSPAPRPKPVKAEGGGDWIQRLCRQIEEGGAPRD